MIIQNIICSVAFYIIPSIFSYLRTLQILKVEIIPHPPLAVFTLLLDCFICTVTNLYLIIKKSVKLTQKRQRYVI